MQDETTRLAEATVKTAEKLAKSLAKGDQGKFDRAKVIYAAVKAGQTTDAIADATSVATVRLAHPELAIKASSGDAVALDTIAALAKASEYKFTRSVANRLGNGFALASDSGLVPNVANVNAAIRAVNRPGSQNARAELKQATLALPTGKREAFFIAGCVAILAVDNSKKREAKTSNDSTENDSTENDSTETTSPDATMPVPPSLDDLLASVAELTARIITGAVVVDDRVSAVLDALNDAWASVPTTVAA